MSRNTIIYTPNSSSARSSGYHSTRSTHPSRQKRYFLLGILLCLLGAYWWIASVGSLRVEPGAYSIEKGQSLSTLDSTLALSVGHTRYRLWVRYFAPSRSLQAGTYTVDQSESLGEFFSSTLVRPTNPDRTITLLPGWSLYDMDEYFAQKGIFDRGAFIEEANGDLDSLRSKYRFLDGRNSVEGFLMPDTYRVRMQATPREVLEVMLTEFQKKIGPAYMSLDSKTAYDTLILASIVEREERDLSEQPIVAGILKKRYLEGTPIGADATVCYGYQKSQKTCTPDFIGSVIHAENPYNTRSTKGLPPTPIASIKASTWENTLHSKDSPYYFYLHDTSGVIHYATTLDEHNANKAKYLQ